MNHVRSLADDLGSHLTRRKMHPARKPLAALAITLGTFLIILGAPALAGADDSAPDAGTTAQSSPLAELAAADDDTDGTTAIGADTDSTDGSADADGTALVGASVAVSADSVAAESVAVSGQSVVGTDIAVNGDNANADGTDPGTDPGTDADGTSVLGPDTDGANSNGNANANGGAGANSDDGNSTGADGGGDPTPAANDPVLANNSGIAPAAAQNTDRQIPETGGPASMIVLMTGIALILAGVVFLAYGRGRALARHLA
jgi:hypothetical protein